MKLNAFIPGLLFVLTKETWATLVIVLLTAIIVTITIVSETRKKKKLPPAGNMQGSAQTAEPSDEAEQPVAAAEEPSDVAEQPQAEEQPTEAENEKSAEQEPTEAEAPVAEAESTLATEKEESRSVAVRADFLPAQKGETSLKTVETAKPAESTAEKPQEPFFAGSLVRYRKSFEAKLILSEDRIKDYYSRVKNELLRYKKVKSRISWDNETFRLGRTVLAKFGIGGKTLTLYLALSPEAFRESKYFFTDKSDQKKYVACPMAVHVKSERGVKYAKELIAEMMKAYETERQDKAEKDYKMPAETFGMLLQRGLIKEVVVKQGTDGEKRAADIRSFIKNGITVNEANREMSDEVASTLLLKKEVAQADGKKDIVNLGELAKRFESGQKVTLAELKEQGLVSKTAGQVKVLAGGVLDKTLFVEANEFSLEAVKMLVLTGGQAIRLVKAESSEPTEE